MIDISESETANRWRINNTPTDEAKHNAQLVIEKIIKPLEKRYCKKIKIHSFYRNPMLNKIVGGAINSQHMKGQAIDINIQGHSTKEIFNYIKANLEFDQLILEKTWVHVSLKAQRNRKEIIQ